MNYNEEIPGYGDYSKIEAYWKDKEISLATAPYSVKRWTALVIILDVIVCIWLAAQLTYIIHPEDVSIYWRYGMGFLFSVMYICVSVLVFFFFDFIGLDFIGIVFMFPVVIPCIPLGIYNSNQREKAIKKAKKEQDERQINEYLRKQGIH